MASKGGVLLGLSAFLESELRALLTDAPATDLDGSEDSESQTQSESQSQSQSQAGAGGSGAAPLEHQLQSRVVGVRATSPSEHMLTLVDRSHMADAFVPQHVVATQVLRKHNYASLAALRGSVIRIKKYHFATARRCELAAANWTPTRRMRTRVCLWVDELTVVDKSDLALNAAPSVDEIADIASLLQGLSDEQLDARITARQGLAPTLPAAAAAASSAAAARVADAASEGLSHDDGDEYPLRDDDCIIPEDQEAQLDAQDGWGRPAETQPSDSQLIADNESQPWDSQAQSQCLRNGDDAYSSMFLTQAPDSELLTQDPLLDDDVSSATEPCEDVSATTEAAATDVPAASLASPTDARTEDALAAAATSASADAVPESQGFAFQAENIATTFVQCSDTESDSDAGHGASSSPQSTSRDSAAKRAAKHAQASQDASAVTTEGADALAASLAQPFEPAQGDADSVLVHIEHGSVEEQERGDSSEQQQSGEMDAPKHDGESDGQVDEDEPSDGDGFPQTQAPESQEGFRADDDDDGASSKLAEDHESEDSSVGALDVAPPPSPSAAAAEPLTSVPDDSVDESTVDRLSVSVSPERLKRARDAGAVSSDEQSAQTTPPATQSDTEADTAADTAGVAIEAKAAAGDLPLAKVSRAEATHTSPHGRSPRALTPAERAIKSYFQTGVPLVITQRDERMQREPVGASARADAHWSRVQSAREPARRCATAALRVASS